MKAFFYACFLFLTFHSQALPFSLNEKIAKGQPGDYIVTEKENNFSLLLLRSQSSSLLVLEEISIPTVLFESLATPSWRQWVEKGAPGHTSWTLFEINLEKGKLQESYSFSQRRWLSWDDSEPFLASVLFLPLEKLPPEQRKRIGPPPLSGEQDRRSLWSPTLVKEGKKMPKAQCEAFRSHWPEDNSHLSLCQIDLYFDSQSPVFPFPFWIEVYNGHYSFKLPVVDSGSNLYSTFRGTIPHRPPFLMSSPQLKEKELIFYLKSPSYYTAFHLFALDVTETPFKTISVPCRFEKTAQKEEIMLLVKKEDLKNLLEPHHEYRWSFIPENFSDVYAENNEIWTWKD